MKRNLTLLAAVAALAAVPLAAATADEPKAPATAEEITAYHDSGEWDQDTADVAARAKKSLTSQLKNAPRKPAIVFDIDDTLESTYACAKNDDFDRTAIAVCTVQKKQDPIGPTKALYEYALKKKVAVFFITGRPEGIRALTEDQLQSDGFGTRKGLYLRPNDDSHSSLVPYKSGTRKAIEKKGYKILVNIGDQKSDLSGGFSVKRFKVPNPMYKTP
jgi:predicted secreted acid phosphatase